MTPFQIILMLAAGFFAYQVYVYIQGIDEDAQPAFMNEPELIEEMQPSSDELIEEADQSYRDGDIEEAKSRLQNIISLYPQLAEPRNKLAFVLSKLGENEEAKKQYRASLNIDADDDMTHNALAALLVSMNEYEVAEEHYQKAIQIDDNYELTWFNYANLMLQLGKGEDAKKMYEKALEIAPDFEEAHEALKKLA